jgi:hypothetical protein
VELHAQLGLTERQAQLAVLKLTWCPGLIMDIVIVRAEMWLNEVER